MSRLQLNAAALIRLQAQVRLTGTFHHRLMAEHPRRSVQASVAIEQCTKALRVEVTHNGTRNTVTLDRQRQDNPARLARFIEETVNGDTLSSVPETGGWQLVSNIEVVLRQAIRVGSGTFIFDADDLQPELVISRNPHGSHIAQIRLNDATSMIALPADPQRAYIQLADHLHSFLHGYRDALAAAA
tara:strand:+ start:2676 stop:3233 length:558 start_codon:yes stop_codon:yes gene_type:complete